MAWTDTLSSLVDIGGKAYSSYTDTTTKAQSEKIKANTNAAATASASEVNSYLAKAQSYKWYIIAGVGGIFALVILLRVLKSVRG